MNRNIALLRWLPRFAVGACASFAVAPSMAQTNEPAATLSPARPVLSPVVIRGATPDSIFPSFTGGYVPSVPAPNGAKDTTTPKASWIDSKWSGLKDAVVGKPNPAPTDAKTSEPSGPTNPIFGKGTPAVAPASGKSPELDPRMNNLGPTNPIFGKGVPTAPVQQPPQSVYASPPAYRWYGWGGTTPGANPHSPTGVYPQASANWYAQTGATPGAFPVTLTPPALETRTVEPPVYAGKVTNEQPFVIGVPSKPMDAKLPEPKPRFISEQPMPEPRVVARTPVGPPPGFEMPASPTLPSGTPMPIASSAEGRTLPAEPPALPSPPVAIPTTELNWQTASGRGVPLPKEPEPAPKPTVEQLPRQGVPSISVIRGQAEGREPQSLEQFVRNACVGRVVRTDVRATSPTKLVVTFVAASENAAREAAALVANLPEMKPYEVTFEAQIVGR